MNEKFYMQDLVNLLAVKHSMDKKDADAFVREFFLLIEEALGNDRYVKIKGLGTFKLIDVDSRESVNVNTGERFQIQGHTKVSFTPDAALRDIINKPFAHFETVVLNENTVLEDTPIDEQDDELDDETERVRGSSLVAETPTADTEEELADLQASVVEAEVDNDIIVATEQKENEFDKTESSENVLDIQLDVRKKRELTAEEIIAFELQKTASLLKSAAPKDEHVLSQPAQLPPKSIQEPHSKNNSSISYLAAIVFFTLLLCGGAILFMYYPDLFSSNTSKEIAPVAIAQRLTETTLLDTIVSTKDTVSESVSTVNNEVVELSKKETVSKKEARTIEKTEGSVKPDSLAYKIVGTKATHVVEEGETLTRVSLRFYGAKAFWPYIVKHNLDIIKNPDNVPFGTKLKIPELVKK